MVRLQSMRQCSVVHNAGLRGPGWDGNRFPAFTLIVCKMQASITRSPAATCVCSAANESLRDFALCKTGRAGQCRAVACSMSPLLLPANFAH